MILDRIEKAAGNFPERIAVHSLRGEMTYGDLWDKSDRLASWLNEKLNDSKTPVAVYGHKDPLMLVCFLACVKSGRAYCPVDTSMADERICDIVSTVGNAVMLATEDFAGCAGFPEDMHIAGPEEIRNAAENCEPAGQESWVKPDDVFYIIFTSGSTGKPKGVQITYADVSNFAEWTSDLGTGREEKAGAVFLNQAPFSFDLSVMDLYTCLANGGTLRCIEKKMQNDHSLMLEYMREGGLEYWVSTPSFAELCLADQSFDQTLLPKMKAFMFCGETLSVRTAKRLAERFPDALVINTYGPTESTCAVTGTVITAAMTASGRALPIGAVKPGTDIFIQDGEIIIAGDTLSTGYFREPEKTAKAFYTDGEGRRCYRTGDSGYFEDGLLYYRGRIDFQVKFHGYRIELGDIEQNLLGLDGVKAAAVIPDRDGDRIKNLAAFITDEGAEGTFEDRQKIRNELRERLPKYMVPKKIVFVDSLPMTPNGKTDRRKLEASL
ncbi:MAG: D-alanine--poly(phosphoribitol) ligase subunit DltA [Eubacteriaceae bacterium]|jgi:D-alanine--poly(phosphoribitol) ligase subunit 1|nr:D-alanine--poly(phosphoribitol) ligase subunit DltA [Eubacteriaceae bacterium]